MKPATILAIVYAAITMFAGRESSAAESPITKLNDIVIYSNALFHCAFPSVVQTTNGDLLVAFRRAPDRRVWGEKQVMHTDPNSQLVLVRSHDAGGTWSKTPELIYANPFGGSQDPCMVKLRDGSILCASYGWAMVRPETTNLLHGLSLQNGFAFLGGYLLRSQDNGSHWSEPIYPPPTEDAPGTDIFGKPIPVFNRGAMCEGRDGRLYWVVTHRGTKGEPTYTELMISADKGETWKPSCPVAKDPKIVFSETSLYETTKGDLVAFMRTEKFNDHTVMARSTDGGKSFEPWEDAGFQGHPHHLLRLPDGRVLLVYGYRHPPAGIRARVLNADCTDFKTAPELILREDGTGFDLGYPWSVMIGDRVLVVYYLNQKDGPRYIAGTWLSIK